MSSENENRPNEDSKIESNSHEEEKDKGGYMIVKRSKKKEIPYC